MPEPSPGAPARPLRPRRNPRWIAAGILAICLGAVGSLLLYSQAARSSVVVSVNRTVMRGETLTSDDLAQVTVGQLGDMKAIPSSQIPMLVGKQALVDLASGSILLEGTVGTPERPDGQAQVGLKLPLGKIPVAPLPQGTRVRLLSVAAADSSAPAASISVLGEIATAPTDAADGSRILDVWVPEASAATIARLAANSQIVLIIEAPR